MRDTWHDICAEDDILMHAGVCALVGRDQVAIFRTRCGIFAIDNYDPFGRANVISRGIVGDSGGELVVASPLYKHHFHLGSGKCLEDPGVSLRTWRVRTSSGRIEIRAESAERLHGVARK